MRGRWVLGAMVAAAALAWQAGGSGAQETHKIGAILPFTGSAASYGDWMRKGMDIALDEVNPEWAKKGKRLEIVYEDSRTNPKDGVTAMNKLIAIDKVPAVMTTITGVTRALKPLADQNKVILTTSATLPGLTEGSAYTLRNATNLGSEVKVLVDFAAKRFKKVAILWVNLEWAKWGAEAFAKQFEAKGGRVAASEPFDPAATDVRIQLTKIKPTDPEALFVLAYKTTGIALKQARELGLKAQFIGTLDFELPEVVQIAKEAAEGAVYTKAAFDPEQPVNDTMRSYVKKYRDRNGKDPEVYGATHYDMVKILALAMEKVGPSPDAMKKFILEIKRYPGASGETTFTPDGDVDKAVDLKTIKGGRHVTYGG